MTKVKICGITNIDDALAACEAGADALGFVFAAEARRRNRYIDPDDARRIIESLPPFVATVAVVVDDPIERLREYLDFIDLIQLHGNEAPDVSAALGARAYKAFRATPGFRLEEVGRWAGSAFLLDAYVPGQQGGTGTMCNWELARRAGESGRRLILAGGLTPENVGEAVRTVRPYAVDTSGGVESAPGKKDHERIRSFIHNAKAPLA